jgi:hypothetical protein
VFRFELEAIFDKSFGRVRCITKCVMRKARGHRFERLLEAGSQNESEGFKTNKLNGD